VIKLRRVEVTYHEEPEGWWATSPDLDGYSAAGATLAEVRHQVSDGLPFLLETVREQLEIDERFPSTVLVVTLDDTFATLTPSTASVTRPRAVSLHQPRAAVRRNRVAVA
jgi:predicted RNase H-like HicB family nuclease